MGDCLMATHMSIRLAWHNEGWVAIDGETPAKNSLTA